MGHNVRYVLLSGKLPLDTAKLVLGLFLVDAVEDETALGVVKETEVIASLGDGENICKNRKCEMCAIRA
jgi:hypothetical protein